MVDNKKQQKTSQSKPPKSRRKKEWQTNIVTAQSNSIESDAGLLFCDNVSFKRQEHKILDRVSFSIEPNEIVTIVGPNGSGKTTILKIICGLLKPDSGKIISLKKLNIGYMPQKVNIEKLMPITVARFLKLRLNNKFKSLEELTEIIDIKKLLNKQLHSLSTGQMQRVLLTRALSLGPDLLVLDEPTSGLDVEGQEKFYQIIEQVKKLYKCSIIMVSHDLHIVMAKTDRVICLNHHICCHGHPEDISTHPEYLALFGLKKNAAKFAVYPHKHDHVHN